MTAEQIVEREISLHNRKTERRCCASLLVCRGETIMADKEIYHVKLHEGGAKWLAYFWPIAMIVFFGYIFLSLDFLRQEESAPYLIDLNEIAETASIDYATRFEIVVRVEKPGGDEIHLYDAQSGKLLGTFVEQQGSGGAAEASGLNDD